MKFFVLILIIFLSHCSFDNKLEFGKTVIRQVKQKSQNLKILKQFMQLKSLLIRKFFQIKI